MASLDILPSALDSLFKFTQKIFLDAVYFLCSISFQKLLILIFSSILLLFNPGIVNVQKVSSGVLICVVALLSIS